MPVFYDTHAHLGDPDFAADLPEVIARAQAAGVDKIVCVAIDQATSQRAIEIAEQFPDVFAAVGWYPTGADQAPADWRPALRELARHPKVVALGETGLDFCRLPSQRPGFAAADDDRYKTRQIELFRQHLEVAAELGLNCVIHQRESLAEALAQFRPFIGRVRGVFHCFVDDAATLRRIIELNSLVSFTGILTFKNGQNVRDTLAVASLGQFMLETDCPYLAPIPYRGKRCEPAYVKEIAAVAAQIKGCSLEELSAATCRTAEEFFRRAPSVTL